MLSSKGIPSFSTRRDITLPTLRSRSPCASWAPPLHRGLVRGSFPAPHHHDPNEMLPNFQIWVMVVCLSNGSSRCHRALEASSLPSCFVLFFSSFVSPLRPLGLGLLGRCDPRNFLFYDVTDAGPASHRVRLWQGGPASTVLAVRRFFVWRLWYSYPSSSSTGTP